MSAAPDEINTSRLQLVRWCDGDAQALRALLDRCDGHLRPWIPFMQQEPRSLEDTRANLGSMRESFDGGEHYRYAIRERNCATIIGETMLLGRGGPNTREVGYWLDEQACGKGFATEASMALLPLAFETLGLARLIIRCDLRNHSSLRVAERLGGKPSSIERIDEGEEQVKLQVFEIWSPRN